MIRNKYFIIGLFIRFIFLFTSGGYVFLNNFIPFLDYFAQNPFSNPWEHFSAEYFPYGLFPLIVLGIPKIIAYQIFGSITLGTSLFNFFLIKVILLFFDLFLFLTLQKITAIDQDRLSWFYWLNPIVIYISFVLGQLDIISISLIVFAIYLVGKNKTFLPGFFIGLAIISKFQVAIVLPFIAAFFWNTNFRKRAFNKIFQCFCISFLVVIIGFYHLISAQKLSYVTFASPEAMRIFAAKILLSPELSLNIGIAFVLIALGRLVFSTRISFLGLVYGSGLLLSVLLISTNASPGWYLWSLPFMALFFSQYVGAPKIIFYGFIFSYFIHFELFKNQSEFYRSNSFTVIQLFIFIIALMIYHIVLKNESKLKNRIKPLMFGISGDSGAGKNHLTFLFELLFGKENTAIIEGDNYHKWERGDHNWDKLTHLNPKANHLNKLLGHANQISKGQSFTFSQYDHKTGRFILDQRTIPKKTIIFQGLHSLYQKSLRELLDLRIYLNPQYEVRTYWKIKRDFLERSHSISKTLESIKKRAPDSLQHILPQKENSDWIIEVSTEDTIEFSNLDLPNPPNLFLRYYLNNDELIFELINELMVNGIRIDVKNDITNIDRLIIEIRGDISSQKIKCIAENIFSHLRHLTRSHLEPEFLNGFDGINQLFLLALISKRLEY